MVWEHSSAALPTRRRLIYPQCDSVMYVCRETNVLICIQGLLRTSLMSLVCYLIAYLYVMKAKANPTNEIELPSTTPSATTPSWLPHVDPIGL